MDDYEQFQKWLVDFAGYDEKSARAYKNALKQDFTGGYNQSEHKVRGLWNEFNASSDTLKRKIKAFDGSGFFNDEKLQNLEALRREFVERYPVSELANLTKETYALGLDNYKDTFCYWLETRLQELGDIHGATAQKFGVYYGKKKSDPVNKWRWTSWTEENFDNVKTELIDLISSGSRLDFNAIALNRLSPMFRGKILATYYPDQFLPIFSYEHIKFFLTQFGIYRFNGIEQSKQKLLELKNNNPELAGFSNLKFMYFLYASFPEVKEKTTEELDDETPEIREITLITKPENYIPKPLKAVSSKVKTPFKIDYEKRQRNNQSIGKIGEQAIVDYEIGKLKSLGRSDLAEKVEWVSKTDDSLGYDVKSYDENGEELHIEVKTTKNTDKDGMAFFLSDNELTNLRSDSKSVIYYVFGIGKKTQIRRINKDMLLNRFDELAKPISYRIECDIEEL